MSSQLANKKTSTSTQAYLDIAEIKDNAVILKDGSIRAVLLASSVNFALKSEDEQNAIIQGYISFLNSLDFPLQIVVQSRKLNIDQYLEDLKQKEQSQTNELLRTQISEYRSFISEMISLGDIMGKRFYIVIPYSPANTLRKGFGSQLSAVFSSSKIIFLSDKMFSQYKEKIQTRIDKVIGLLSSIGITAVPLSTENLVELYYESYNPELAQIEKIHV